MVDDERLSMKLALDELADNPILDELLFWMPKDQRIVSLRACSVLFRRPFIEFQQADGKMVQRHFERASFAGHWAEALVILETLTDIEIVSDFAFTPVSNRQELVDRALACRERCIAEADKMFEQGFYGQYLYQFGENCRELPAQTRKRIAEARQKLADQTANPAE
jgi:hypothetical protein